MEQVFAIFHAIAMQLPSNETEKGPFRCWSTCISVICNKHNFIHIDFVNLLHVTKLLFCIYAVEFRYLSEKSSKEVWLHVIIDTGLSHVDQISKLFMDAKTFVWKIFIDKHHKKRPLNYLMLLSVCKDMTKGKGLVYSCILFLCIGNCLTDDLDELRSELVSLTNNERMNIKW